jgi:hypothetical protein
MFSAGVLPGRHHSQPRLLLLLQVPHEIPGAHMQEGRGARGDADSYAKLGYVEHEDQPPEEEEGKGPPGYTILTRRLVAAAPAQRALRPVTNSIQLENIIFG